MLTLSYGYKKPQSGDRGPVVFPAMEDNIDRLNSHTHNGIDSPILGVASFSTTSQLIPSGSWVLVSNGIYKQTVVLIGLTFDNLTKEFRLSSGEIFYPTIKKLSNVSYEIYINDNTETVTAYYR